MIRLERIGPPSSGTPVVMIPGIDGSNGSVLPIAEALARNRPVFVADYTAERNGTVESLSVEIARAIGDAIPEPFDIIGQSIGTIFASQVATGKMVPVRRVVLCCTFTRVRWKTLRVSNALLAITPRSVFSATAPMMMKLVCGPVGDGSHHPFFSASRHADKQGVLKRTAWQIGRDFSPDIGAIDAPLLVLMGERDRFVPDIGRELATLRSLLAERNARVCTVPNAGHVLLPSSAVSFAAQTISEFLRTPILRGDRH